MRRSIRDILRAEMDRQGLTPNALAVKLAGKVSRAAVYAYLGERDRGYEMSAGPLLHVLSVLNLEITRRSDD